MVASEESGADAETETETDFENQYPSLFAAFSAKLDFENLPSYNQETQPNYVDQDNTSGNPIANSAALLGRILFYDKNLSSNNTTSCSSCHTQAQAFGSLDTVSAGANGITARHSMRLVNARFGEENNFFWDERVSSLEAQVTLPIQNHEEMGFSGANGAPGLDDLILKLSDIEYYGDLFAYAYGSEEVTEDRIQRALAQFIRSLQSFDSKYDTGRALTGNDNADFPNFSVDENAGKRLFLQTANRGGANCAVCHRPPEFDIVPNARNNGVIGVFGSSSLTDTTVTRTPTLRDLVGPDGSLNGPLMHDGSHVSLEAVIEHYDNEIVANANLDNRLQVRGSPQRLGLSVAEKAQLVLFLKTLSGTDIYTNEKWADPF